MPERNSFYEPRDPTHSILYHLVQDHFETFRAQAASLRDGEGLPRFVEREFREFLILQRFGGALNLNVHVHALVIDGVFVNDGERLRFQTVGRLRRDDVAEVVAVVAHRIDRLQRRGVMATSEESGRVDRWAEEAPALAGLAAASVQQLLALGPRAGERVARYGSPPQDVAPVTLGPCHANDLRHLGLATDRPEPQPARAPPRRVDDLAFN